MLLCYFLNKWVWNYAYRFDYIKKKNLTVWIRVEYFVINKKTVSYNLNDCSYAVWLPIWTKNIQLLLVKFFFQWTTGQYIFYSVVNTKHVQFLKMMLIKIYLTYISELKKKRKYLKHNNRKNNKYFKWKNKMQINSLDLRVFQIIISINALKLWFV